MSTPGSVRSPPGSGTGDNPGTVGVVRERPAAMLQARRSFRSKRRRARFAHHPIRIKCANLSAASMAIVDQSHRRIPTGRSRMPPTSFAIAACRGGFCAAETSIKDHVLEDVCTISNLPGALRSPLRSGTGDNPGTVGVVRERPAAMLQARRSFRSKRRRARFANRPLRIKCANLSAAAMAIVDQSHRKIPTGRSRTPPTSFAIAAGQGGFCAAGTSIKTTFWKMSAQPRTRQARLDHRLDREPATTLEP